MTIKRPMFPPRAESVDSFSLQPGTGQPGSQTLTSESPKPAGGIGRRGLLIALAGLPVAVPAAAAADPDPILEAIQTCRTAKQASDEAYSRVKQLADEFRQLAVEPANKVEARRAFMDRALGCDEDDYTNGPASALWDAYDDFIQTVPTTLAGLSAMLVYAAEITCCEGDPPFDEGTIFPTLAAAAKALIGVLP